MANHFKLPALLPFRFVRNTRTPGIHFDDDWSCNQLTYYELKAYYAQKWQHGDTTKIQCESSIMPQPIKYYTPERDLVKQTAWTIVGSATGYKIYEVLIDFSDLPNDSFYFLFIAVQLLAIDWSAISEPIHVKTEWPNTLLYTYKHRFNDYDVAFSTGISFKFRCESGLPVSEFTPEGERSSYTNQTYDVSTLWGVPARTFKLLVGHAPGVPPWVLDKLHRILICSYVSINGRQYQAPEGIPKWEITRVKGYPFIGATTELVYGYNRASSVEFATDGVPGVDDGSDGSGGTPGSDLPEGGLVTAYNIETAFFGPGALVPITEIEHNG